MELVRSFIAIELPADVRAGLASIEEKLKVRRHSFVKWADPQSIHLTLKFLGSVSGETIPEIVEAMSLVAQPVSPFTLQIGGTGAFPNWQRPQIVWVGVGGEMGRLTTLQRELEAALSPLGFPPESRPFSPHLTLGRLRERVTPEDRQRFGLWAQSVKFEASLSFEVNAVRLMKSQLAPSGPIYSELASVKLKAQD